MNICHRGFNDASDTRRALNSVSRNLDCAVDKKPQSHVKLSVATHADDSSLYFFKRLCLEYRQGIFDGLRDKPMVEFFVYCQRCWSRD